MLTMRNRWLIAWGLAVVFALASGRANAQSFTGQISGTVQDSSGAVIPEASVTLTNSETGASRTLPSSANGEFVFTALSPGNYTVKVEKQGFQTYERKTILLTVSQRLALGNVSMVVGAVTPDRRSHGTRQRRERRKRRCHRIAF